MFKMKGVVPPMITPFTKSGEVDYEGLRTLVKYLKNEVHGLFVTGSYGSGALMNLEERKKVVEVCVETVEGKIPVIPMVGTTNTRDSVELTKHAAAVGAQAVSAVGPYYFTHNEHDVSEFYLRLIEASSLPVYLYNNPNFQGYPISLELISALKDKGLAGIKDATFSILDHAKYCRLLKDDTFDVVLGTEAMWLSARALGAEAFIPGLANAFPEIVRKMYEEGMRNEFEACRETQFEVNALRDVMYLAPSTQLAVYAMLEIRGIVKAYPRAPFTEATAEQKENIKKALMEMKVL